MSIRNRISCAFAVAMFGAALAVVNFGSLIEPVNALATPETTEVIASVEQPPRAELGARGRTLRGRGGQRRRRPLRPRPGRHPLLRDDRLNHSHWPARGNGNTRRDGSAVPRR